MKLSFVIVALMIVCSAFADFVNSDAPRTPATQKVESFRHYSIR